MPEDGCNQYKTHVRNVVICSCLEQLTHWAALTTCENQVREQIPFSFYFATIWHHMCFMNKHHQLISCQKMGATSTIQKYLMYYFVPVWSNWHIGQYSLPARTKYENRWLLVFTLPLDWMTCVSWINTINQYNARRWVQPVPGKCT